MSESIFLAQRIAFVEYFLKGGISWRDIFFNHPGRMKNSRGEFVLVDGLQRLTAARRFLANEIPAFNSYRREYTDHGRLSNHCVKFHVASLKTRADVLQWNVDLNAGGTPARRVEDRSCARPHRGGGHAPQVRYGPISSKDWRPPQGVTPMDHDPSPTADYPGQSGGRTAGYARKWLKEPAFRDALHRHDRRPDCAPEKE